MFDVEILCSVTLAAVNHAGVVASAHIELMGDVDRGAGFWRLHGKSDRRLPAFWGRPQRWRVAGGSMIQLLHNGKPWAQLHGVPRTFNLSSKGLLQAYRLPGGPSGYQPNGWYVGEWAVITNAKHRNMPNCDVDAGVIARAVASCSRDTGWRYDTSSGWGAAVGAGVGGGLLTGTLVMKRKEGQDARRWRLDYRALGFGFMTPTAGTSASSEDMPSTALSPVMAGPGQANPFPVADFGGTIAILDGGGGVGVGKGRVGAGGGGSSSLFMFLGVSSAGYGVLDYTQIKACAATGGFSAGGGKGQGLGLSGIIYVGTVSVGT
jgi:hypothetical protein